MPLDRPVLQFPCHLRSRHKTNVDRRRCRRSYLIGTVIQYPTKADVLRVIERFRMRINLKHRFARPVTLDAVVDHYVKQELPVLRYGTQQSHLCSLNRWILPRWGEYLLEQIKAVDVEEWLRSLPLAPKSKVNIRSFFHLIYVHARRWELTDSNLGQGQHQNRSYQGAEGEEVLQERAAK